jgi:hypothetical protein
MEGAMSEITDSPESKFTESFAPDYVQQMNVHTNFDQNIVIVTEDRLELCLRNHLECISRNKAWITPASLLAAFVTTLCTSSFKDSFGLSAATWQALFVLFVIVTGIWSVLSGIDAFRNRSSLRQLIDAIKKSAKLTKGTDQPKS